MSLRSGFLTRPNMRALPVLLVRCNHSIDQNAPAPWSRAAPPRGARLMKDISVVMSSVI